MGCAIPVVNLANFDQNDSFLGKTKKTNRNICTGPQDHSRDIEGFEPQKFQDKNNLT